MKKNWRLFQKPVKSFQIKSYKIYLNRYVSTSWTISLKTKSIISLLTITYKTRHKIPKTYNISVEIPGPLGGYNKTKSNPLFLKIIPQYYTSYNLQGWILAKNRAKGWNLTPSNPLKCKNLTPWNPVISRVLTIFFQNLTLFRKLFQKNKKRHFLNLKNFFSRKGLDFQTPNSETQSYQGFSRFLEGWIWGWIFT